MKKILTLILVLFSTSAFADNACDGYLTNDGSSAMKLITFRESRCQLGSIFLIRSMSCVNFSQFLIMHPKSSNGKDGQAAYAVFAKKYFVQAKRCMATGSGGCTRDFVINYGIYELFGGAPVLVYADETQYTHWTVWIKL